MDKFKDLIPHAIAHVAFFVLASIFFFPLYQGKTLTQSDNIQLRGTLSEVAKYRKEEGRNIKWSNKEFSGMPTLTGSPTNPFYYSQAFFSFFLQSPIIIMLFAFVGFYLLLSAFDLKIWMRALGGFAYAFSTFNLISLEAGHDNKVYAMAFMAPILAGTIWAYRGQFLKGFSVTVVATGYQVYFGHIQISYYTIIILLSYFLFQLVRHLKEGRFSHLLKPSAFLLLAGLLGVLMVIPKIWAIQEYSPYSTRGGSELRVQDESGPTTGLDKSYAYRWSNGVMEVFTVAFPYFHGGASAEPLGDDSHVAEVMRRNRVDRNTSRQILSSVPLYWGQQPGTAGPLYFGVIIVFLFITGYFVLDRRLMVWATILCAIGFLLSMGKNLQWFSDLFFDYVPLYNKFRSVTMIMSIPQLIFPLVASLSLSELLYSKDPIEKKFKIGWVSAAIILGIGAFFLITKSMFFEFSSPSDPNLAAAGYPEWLIGAIQTDRIALFNKDIYRAFLLVGLAFLLCWAYWKNRIKENYLIAGLLLLCFFDLWLVNKRYITYDGFFKKQSDIQALRPSVADQQIGQDSEYYRVFNLAGDPFNDGVTSYHHYSIGGYNAIKIQRYQDLIERHISAGNRNVLNMLNARYYITRGNDGAPRAQRNQNALGHAWSIQRINWVEGATQEIDRVGQINTAVEVAVDAKYQSEITKSSYSGTGTIEMTDYDPEHLTYNFQADEDQYVVFSEVWYGPGWVSLIDGEEVPHQRVNYTLRGMPVPAGTHELEFVYRPKSVRLGELLSWTSSVIVILLIVGGARFGRRLLGTTAQS